MNGNGAVANRFYQTYQAGPANNNRNQFIQTVSDRLMDNTCPIVLRRFKEAEFSYESKNLNAPDGQNIRIKILVATTVGTLFSLATRVVRTAVRTLALPVSLLYSLGKQQYYGFTGEVTDELKRTWHEWVDLGVSLVLPFIGVVKFFKPDFAQGFTEKLMGYYLPRIDDRLERDRVVKNAINQYRTNRNAVQRAWDHAQPAPVLVRG